MKQPLVFVQRMTTRRRFTDAELLFSRLPNANDLAGYLFWWLLKLTENGATTFPIEDSFETTSMISSSYGSSKAITWRLGRAGKGGEVKWKENQKLCHFQNSLILHTQCENQAVVDAPPWTWAIASESQPLFFSPWWKDIDYLGYFEADFSD